MYRGDEGTWSQVRNGSGSTAIDNSGALLASIESATSSGQWATITRSALLFDTSSIGSGSTILSATLNLYVDAKYDDFSQNIDIVASTPATNVALLASDYGNFGTTVLGTIAISSLTTGAYNAIALNPTGLAAISKTGITKLGMRVSGDTSDTEPSWISGGLSWAVVRSADTSGTGSDPRLEVHFE